MDLEERLTEFITSTFVNRCSVFDIQKELQRGLIPPEWLPTESCYRSADSIYSMNRATLSASSELKRKGVTSLANA